VYRLLTFSRADWRAELKVAPSNVIPASPTSSAPHIGIVGGGPGGLFSAYLLQKYLNRPVRLTVLEAGDRLGGKIHTPRFTTANVTYEAGAAEIYDYSVYDEDPLRDLIEELGLPITPMGGSAVVVDQKVVANLDDLRRHFGEPAERALRLFDTQAESSLSPREFYWCDHADVAACGMMDREFQPLIDSIAHPAARRYVQSMIHSDLATEPARTNLEYGLHNYLMNNPRYMRLYSIEGGNERLPQALVDRTAAAYQMQRRVTRVGRSAAGQYIVHADHAGVAERYAFDDLILALPNTALPTIEFEGELLQQAMHRHLVRYDHPAHYLRITCLFDRPFWRGHFPESYVMLDAFGGCCLYDESQRNPGCRQGVLGWLIAGENARQMSDWDNARLVEAALDSLPSFLPDGRRHLLEGVVRRWVSAVNAMPGGRSAISLDARHQPEPLRHPELFVVGDYLFDSTLNGVLDSAEYVASRIAANLNHHNGSLS
jgi:monoamine oxidase